MKLFSMNVHGLLGDRERSILSDFLRTERPSVVALQEVCQTRSEQSVPSGRIRCLSPQIPLREDNGLPALSKALGEDWHICYLPVKVGYGTRDEGLAMLCRFPIGAAWGIPLTPERSYGDWRRRCALAVRGEGRDDLFVCLHTSWWEEGFLEEWSRLEEALRAESRVWLLGDLNLPASHAEAEACLHRGGYADAFDLAECRQGGVETVRADADGWRGRQAEHLLRIDRILCRPARSVSAYRRVLDGVEGGKISDHFGVLIEYKEESL